MRRARTGSAFTLVEALVSIAIMAGMILMLATIFRQSAKLTSSVRGGAAAQQAARQIFEAIGRDLAGVTRDGFLFIRTQQLEFKSGSQPSGLILFYDTDGAMSRVNGGRMDVMVMTVAGYHTSAVDAARAANFARVIWAQTERASGNNLDSIADTPKFWAINQVLARHQTLMLPDDLSADLSNSSYASNGGKNRGPDSFNMAVSDLTRFFGAAMGAGGPNEHKWGDRIQLPIDSYSCGLFSTNSSEGKQELAPYRWASKVWRFGRSGRGPDGESPGREGAGDLTMGQINSDYSVPNGFLGDGPKWAPRITGSYLRDDCIRGHERPRIYGPKDYHRLAAFGVGSLQVDFSDGRRVAVKNSSGEWVGTKLQFYPGETEIGGTMNLALMGPGETRSYCWNSLSPTCIRDSGLRKSFQGTTYSRRYQSYSTKPDNWLDINRHTQNMFEQYCSSGGGRLGNQGWPWPRAIRIRLLIYDVTQSPPVGYQFEQIFHMMVQ